MAMWRLAILLAAGLCGCPDPSTPIMIDAAPDAPDIDARLDRGCNPATGAACACVRATDCPVGTDKCANIPGAGGRFCSNACTTANAAANCAVQQGQPGTGACLLTLDSTTDGGAGGDHCLILCGAQMACPPYFVAMTLGGQCVCVPPG
jgi:hypothetical protein